ncbi:MAG TPA: group II intron reverse transcriptase/maturase [Isosphaeraceae bacterium]|nr:group II intron reverse transcriptase/maturase [Isosphaeraceae bacterium]
MDKLEPKGKLGAMSTIQAVPVHDGVVADVVNGPEDEVLDWRSVEWRAVEDNVRRLRQRIFMASRAGDLKRVRNLQKLMLRSRSNALVSVRRVTEVNTGRNTPGIDGRVVTLAPVKADLAVWIQRDSKTWCARPVKRVYISKANGKRRPLGIPVIVDRVLQALTVNALEPEWEARFEPKSYGFRPGRGCHDAIEAIHKAVSGKNAKRLWGLDADLTAAFDHIDHGVLLESLGSFPAKETIRGWLTAGVMEDGQITTTDAGTPQGGVISPLLLNVALHGLEQAAGVRYQPHGTHAGLTIPGAPILVRYADDLVALCHTGAQAEQVHARLTEWLAPRGLTFNDGKTQTVHVGDGFDFLGFNVRRYRNGKVLCKPSKAAVRRIRERLAAEMRALRGSNAAAVVARLNPIIRGWSAYYQPGVSKKTFTALDYYLWTLTYKWARHGHPKKPKRWVVARYFGAYNKSRNDRWVFGDRDSGFYLRKFAWTKIVRHRMVKGRSSPDDPTLAAYWAQRRQRGPTPLGVTVARRLTAQGGRCPICGSLLLIADRQPQSPQEWERWIVVVQKAVRVNAITADTRVLASGDPADTGLVHAHCQRRRATTVGSPSAPPARG